MRETLTKFVAVLAEGGGGLTAQILSERFEATGAQFGHSVGREMASVELRSLTEFPYLASKATRTSTIGSFGARTRETRAPFAVFQVSIWRGSSKGRSFFRDL